MATLLNTQQQGKTASAAEPRCSFCKGVLRTRVKRPLFVKLFLFWLPLKRYYCSRCARKVHVLEHDSKS